MPEDDKAPASPVAHAITQAMLQMNAGIEPIFEAGNGLRLRLIDEGWSEEAAELIAREVVLGLIRKVIPT